jgi:hypothetical protein
VVKRRQLLLPEGIQIAGRQAKLVKLEGETRWFLYFDPNDTVELAAKSKRDMTIKYADSVRAPVEEADPFTQPLEVLPGRWLTAMTRVTGQKVDMSVTFRVWGEVTTYRNRNFILPTRVMTVSIFGEKGAGKEKKESTGLSALRGSGVKKEEPAAEEKADPQELPEKIRKTLMALPRSRPVELGGAGKVEPKEGGDAQVSGGGMSMGIWKDGHMVIDRVGRLTIDEEEGRSLFAFEADTRSLAEPPVVLLPCQLLEVMEKTASGAARSVKFRITGQVTRYQQRNYMLLRKLLIEYDSGNFGY